MPVQHAVVLPAWLVIAPVHEPTLPQVTWQVPALPHAIAPQDSDPEQSTEQVPPPHAMGP